MEIYRRRVIAPRHHYASTQRLIIIGGGIARNVKIYSAFSLLGLGKGKGENPILPSLNCVLSIFYYDRICYILSKNRC